MLLHVTEVLDADQARQGLQRLREAHWGDGRVTAGHQSARAKHNRQLRQDDPLAVELGQQVLAALSRHATFFAGALPRHIFPPLFNCYQGGGYFDFHVDNAVRYDASQQPPRPLRTDLAATVFFSEPDSYDGGELVIEDTYGTHNVKLPAGDLVLYPASSLHKVTAVTRGARYAAFFWIQSMIRDETQRRLLLDLDVSIQQLTQKLPDAPELLRLTSVYHNLLRQWAEV